MTDFTNAHELSYEETKWLVSTAIANALTEEFQAGNTIREQLLQKVLISLSSNVEDWVTDIAMDAM